VFFFFSSRRRHTRFSRDWSSDVCSSDLFVVLVMIGLTLSAFLTKHSEKAQFRVAAYNIRYAAQIDEESGNGWVIRKGPLASLIQRHQFDIVGTQEGDGNQMNDLKHLLPEFDQILHPYGG